MSLNVGDLDLWLRPAGGWPGWVTTVPYRGDAHPHATNLPPLNVGANCQRYAYAVLGLFGRQAPPHRSSELWDDPNLTHHGRDGAQDLDLALFNDADNARGAHVAVVVGDRLLHLCAEEGRPALWSWRDFAARPRYTSIVGLVRI